MLLTNKLKSFQNTFDCETGLSDYRKLVATIFSSTFFNYRQRLQNIEGTKILMKIASLTTYNHFHNILRLFTNFCFTTSETMRDYYL